MVNKFIGKINHLSPAAFNKEIEENMKRHKMDVIQAVIYYCEKNGLDLTSVPELLTPELRSKLEQRYQDLNFLPKTSKLPL